MHIGGLAELYRKWGRYDEAEPLSRHSLAVLEAALGPEHAKVGLALNNLGKILVKRGHHDEADGLYRRSLGISERIHGADHPTVAVTLHNLSELRRLQGRLDEAESLGWRSLGIWEKRRTGDHPLMAACLGNLAELRLAQGRTEEAESMARRCLGMRERCLGIRPPRCGRSAEDRGRYSAGEQDGIRRRSRWKPVPWRSWGRLTPNLTRVGPVDCSSIELVKVPLRQCATVKGEYDPWTH